jgi:ABC-type branched-subunit amino acid transport system substrate-binding protein
VIHFSVAADPTIAKGDYNFIHWTPPVEEATTLISELEKREIKKIAVFGANISGIIAVADEINRLAPEKNITVTDTEIFNFGTTDFRTQIKKAMSTGPEMYVLLAFSQNLSS